MEVAKTKHNALDVTEINDFFIGDNLVPEQMEHIYSYLEGHNIDVIPVIDDAALSEDVLLLNDDVDIDDDDFRGGDCSATGQASTSITRRNRFLLWLAPLPAI